MAQGVLHQIAQRLALGCVALFLSDGYSPYLTAIVTHFGHWVQPPQRQVRGPVPKLRWMPLPELLYAQVVKTVRQRRLVAVKHRVGFGTRRAIEQVLTACSWRINTAFVERLNLSRVSGWRLWDGAALRRVRAKMDSASTWRCSRCITISSCPMPACARRWRRPLQPMVVAQPRDGDHARLRWRRDAPITSGACEKY